MLTLLQDRDLPLRETKIDRHARPLEPWNVRPTIAERNELQLAHREQTRRALELEVARGTVVSRQALYGPGQGAVCRVR